MKKFIVPGLIAFIILAGAAVLLPFFAESQIGINTLDGGWNVPPSTLRSSIAVPIVGQSNCKVKNNSTTKSYFIPTKYATTEWIYCPAISPDQAYRCPIDLKSGCCGDGFCDYGNLGETAANCPSDCQTTSYCGNSDCESGETVANCFYDCTYGACTWPVCEGLIASACASYLPCTWDPSRGLDGECTTKININPLMCWSNQTEAACNANQCDWIPSMHRIYLWCGDNICSSLIQENSTNCPPDCGGAYCGDSICSSSETCSSCSADCGACTSCGDGICNGSEDSCSCSADCGAVNPRCLATDPDGLNNVCDHHRTQNTCITDPYCYWYAGCL